MRNLMTTVAGSVAVVLLLAAPASAQYVYGPVYGAPPVAFSQALPITGQVPEQIAALIFRPPVRSPLGTVIGRFARVELHDGELPVGIVTVRDHNRTVSVPLDRLRFDPVGGQVLTDMSWNEMALMPSGRRLPESRCHP